MERSDLFVEVFHKRDRGETAAICYAVEHGVNLVLLDERDGRRVARRHDLDVTGVIDISLRGAKTEGIDPEQELDALRDAGFWISEFGEEVGVASRSPHRRRDASSTP